MSISGKGRKPLVADRRYGAPRASVKAPPPAPPRKQRGRRPARKHGIVVGSIFGLVTLIWRVIWGVTWRVGAFGFLILAGAMLFYYAQLSPMSEILDARARGSVTLLDNEGKVFAWRGETFGGEITSDTVSDHLRNAVIATEDKRFYTHLGVSPRGIASAIRINLAEGRGPLEGNGGSTITQQVAKLLCMGVIYDPTLWKDEADYEEDCRGGGIVRKVKEIPYAIAMELKYSKADILTIYFNRAYLGAGARGFEAAAQRYFGKSANEVNPAEAAMLAGLLKAPSYFAPTNDLQRSRDRASVILGLMQEQGYLTAEEVVDARENPARLSKAAAAKSGGYFADWVMETGPAYLTKDTTEDVVMLTTLDQRLQRLAEEALDTVFAEKVSNNSKAQAAIVVMSADGAVRAIVGGHSTDGGGTFNRATQAVRQTGSTFKPFIYAAALDMGYSPADFVQDTPLTINIPGSGPYTPENYDRKFKGLITLTQALAESRNIPAVKVSEFAGRDVVRDVATKFGIARDLADGPALALGASEATLMEMTGAYAGILNGGTQVKPYGLVELKLQGDDTPLIGEEGGRGDRVISEQSAKLLTYMMMQVIQSGTGKRAQLDRDAAGKTGTTDAQKDAWFVGFTADYVVGVWMGNDDNTPLNDVTGGGIPAEIWREVMVRINEGVPARPLEYIVPEPRLPPGSTAAAVPQPAERELTAAERAEAKRARQDRRERREERRRRDPLGDALREIFRNP